MPLIPDLSDLKALALIAGLNVMIANVMEID